MAFTHINPFTPIRGQNVALGISSNKVLVTGPGRVFNIIVVTAPSSAASVLDSTGSTVTAANTILSIPTTATVGQIFVVDCPYFIGLSLVVSGGVFNVIYD